MSAPNPASASPPRSSSCPEGKDDTFSPPPAGWVVGLPAAATGTGTLASPDWRANFVSALSSRKGCRSEEEEKEEDATESCPQRMREWVGDLNALPPEKLGRLQPTPGGKGQRHPGSRRLPPTASDRAARECRARSLADTSVYLRLRVWKSSPESPPHSQKVNIIRPRQAMNGGREAAQRVSPQSWLWALSRIIAAPRPCTLEDFPDGCKAGAAAFPTAVLRAWLVAMPWRHHRLFAVAALAFGSKRAASARCDATEPETGQPDRQPYGTQWQPWFFRSAQSSHSGGGSKARFGCQRRSSPRQRANIHLGSGFRACLGKGGE